MLFADVVAASETVRAIDVRQDKVERLAQFLRSVPTVEVSHVVELLLRAQLFDDVAPDRSPTHRPLARTEPSLTCEAVAGALAAIDRAPADGLRRALLNELLLQATRAEQFFIERAATVDRLDRMTFDLVVSAAARAARVSVGSLRRAATLAGSLSIAVRIALERDVAGLEAVTFEPGRPIPMTRVSNEEPPDVLLELSADTIVEPYPGLDHIQVHRYRDEVTIYDEQLNDVTSVAPAIVEQVQSLPRGDLVLDGWASLELPAQHVAASASWMRTSRADDDDRRARFFDVLFDDVSVTEEPLSTRRELLEAIVPAEWRVGTVDVSELESAARALNEAHDRGYPGLVVKPLSEPYEGGLVRSSWFLVRATRIVKLVAVAAERGTGARTHLLSTVHLAATDSDQRLSVVAKTAQGLTDEQIVWQTEVFAQLMLGDRETGDRLFRLSPEVVAYTSFEDVDRSDRFDGGIELLQARILGYERPSHLDVATIDELRGTEHLGTARAGESDDEPSVLPRLPPRPLLEAAEQQSAADRREALSTPASDRESVSLAVGSANTPPPARHRTIGDVEFDPYEEPELPGRQMSSRAVLLARGAVLAWIVALVGAALAARSDDPDASTISTLSWVGIPLVAVLAVTGWWWSDRTVQTIKLLDGRRPGRARCMSAWLLPPIVTLALAVGVVPLEPTEVFDVRPVVIAGVFALVTWRPYSLVRRMLQTLTRTRSDVLIASGYIIDLLGFGVLWWRLTQLDEQPTTGELDLFVGAIGAVAVAMAAGVAVWIGLVRACRSAVRSRRLSQRTRYEHRMLRLRGVDPTDPEVWWELVQRRADEERARAALSPTGTDPTETLPTVDDLIETTRREHSVAFRRLDEAESLDLERQLRAEFAAILAGGAPGTDGEPREGGLGEARHGDEDTATGLQEDPVAAIRRSGRGRPDERTPSTIEVLINRAGGVQVDAALAQHRRRLEEEQPSVRMVPPRLAAIEAARLVLALAFGALTAVSGWLVVAALGVDPGTATGRLPDDFLDEFDLARRIFWGLLSVGAAMVPVWAFTILRMARRVGIPGLRSRRVKLLAVLSIAACGAGFVVDPDRGIVTLLLMMPILWSAIAASFCVEPVRLWFRLAAATLTSWTATLPVVTAVAWLAGLVGPLDPTASVQALAFTTILLTLGCARVAAMSVLTSIDLEDELRSSPEIAVPAAGRTLVRSG